MRFWHWLTSQVTRFPECNTLSSFSTCMKLPVLPTWSIALLILSALGACEQTESIRSWSVESPSGNNHITFQLLEEGIPVYSVTHDSTVIIDTSQLGFIIRESGFWNIGFDILRTGTSDKDYTWEQPWGEQRQVRDNYNELLIELMQMDTPFRRFNIRFRAYDDGVAFRYEFPKQEGYDTLIIEKEKTQFQLTGDHTVWWTPGDWDIYEHLYNTSSFSEIDAIAKRDHPALAQTYIPFNAVNTPVTMRTSEGIHLCFHEAHLEDFAGMTLLVDTAGLIMESELVGSDRLGYKVLRELPFNSPWRTITISDSATGLLASDMILNLNPPSRIKDVSWFTPMKYVGIWWEMHLDKSRWDLASGKHGATTAHAKELIDFAAANNIGGVLVEGWNTGWEHWIGFEDREGVFDFVTPYPDYDLDSLAAYADSLGVRLIMHHETSAAPRTYEQQLDTAYALMQSLGIHTVKTGYVGKIIPKGEYHHGQWMVNHYRKVLETAARYQVAVNAHEPIKDTGERRTFPNAVSREGMRGQEFNAWSPDGGNPPEHLPIVAYTRMVAGPFDFTPGIFNLTLEPYKKKNQVNTTLAHQLALYVVIYSPVQMAADLIEYYTDHPAFQFIRDVRVDWEQSLPMDGEVGDYVVMAREERETGNWFVGGITDELARNYTLFFDYLPEDAIYNAVIYRDKEDSHYRKNPQAFSIDTMSVQKGDSLSLYMAPGGGFAISLILPVPEGQEESDQ